MHPGKEAKTSLTFIDVWGQTAHEHLTGEALDAFAVLVGVTVGGSEDTLVTVPIVKETVLDGEQGGAA